MNVLNIKQLRLISLIEGISYLLLLFIGMPLKYGVGIKEVNHILGMGHGILTIVFCIMLSVVWTQKTLSSRWCIVIFIASLIPFGAFFIERNLKKHAHHF